MLGHQNNLNDISRREKVQKFNNVILFGGETKSENIPTGFYSSLALLPLRGKPVIFRQLENLKNSYGLDNCCL